MADWVRVSRGVKTDPKVYELAARLHIAHEAAIGLLVNLWLELPDHAKDGQINGVPDLALEDWAAWRGKRGAFAAAYRALFQTPEGRVNAWQKHNGRALAKSEREAERVRQWREKRESGDTANENGTHNRTSARTRTERVPIALRTRNETRRNGTPPLPSDADASEKDSPGRGGWPAVWAEDYLAIGVLDPGRIGKRCAVVVAKYGPERARSMWRHYIHFRPHKRFGEYAKEHHDTKGMGPEDFVATSAEWWEMDETFDPAKHL